MIRVDVRIPNPPSGETVWAQDALDVLSGQDPVLLGRPGDWTAPMGRVTVVDGEQDGDDVVLTLEVAGPVAERARGYGIDWDKPFGAGYKIEHDRVVPGQRTVLSLRLFDLWQAPGPPAVPA